MWNFKSFSEFLAHYKKLDRSRQILVFSSLFLAFLYPGHNYLQRLILHPSPVKSYILGDFSPSLYPQNDGVKAPGVSASAVIIQDSESKTLIYAKNPDTTVLPASTTKIMTALVALDNWPDLDTVIEVKNEDRAIGQTIELQKGERLTIRSVLYGLLVHSGNDAALALADNYPGGYQKFVDAMNQKAKSLHLDHTNYRNPSGIEQYDHRTSARDLAILASVAISNPLIAEIASTKFITISNVENTLVHPLQSTNELLGVLPGIKGLKTGWTENAGECLISVVERDGHTLIVVIMDSLDRFGETTKLVEWAYAHHNWIIPAL